MYQLSAYHSHKKILTYLDISSSETRMVIDQVYDTVYTQLRAICRTKLEAECQPQAGSTSLLSVNPQAGAYELSEFIPEDTELVIGLWKRNDVPTYHYYLVSWESRVVMWCDEINVSLLTNSEDKDCYCTPRLGRFSFIIIIDLKLD